MRRFLWLWLTLLGAFWAARTLVSAALFQRAGHEGSFLALAAIPTAQAAVLWWVTRGRGKKAG